MRKSTQVLITFAALALCATLITGCSAKARMVRHQQHADRYFEAGEYPKAEVEYLIALQLDNANAHSLTRLGTIYFEEGRYRRAFAFIKRASELSTNDMDLHVKLGTIYLIAQKPKEARDEAELILDISPTNADAPDILAESIASRADIDSVQKRLEKLSKQIGDTAPLEVGFCVLDFASGNLKAGEAALQRALSLNPKYGPAYFTLGNLYLSQNKLKEADAAFKSAAELAPPRSPKRLSYANFKIQTGDIAEGKRLIAEILKGTPDYLPARLREAEIALVEKRYDDCDALLTRGLAQDADNYEALLLWGRSYLAQGRGDKAIAELERTAALYDHSPEAQYYLALAHLSASDTAKASADLAKAVFLRPQYPDAIVLLAGLNISRGDTSSAISSLTQLIQYQPQIPSAYLLLANAYVIQKNPNQALATYAKMAELFPQNPQVPLLMGMVQSQQKRPAEARKAFEKALELAPHFSPALEAMANLDVQENQFAAALDLVNKEAAPEFAYERQLLLATIHLARAGITADKETKNNSNTPKLNIPAVQDDVNQAESELLKAVEMNPIPPAPYLLLGKLYVAAGKEQAALDRLNALVSKTNNVAAYMQIGMINDTMKNYPAARDAYEKLLTINPDFSSALNNLSYLYSERLGQPDKGITMAERAHQLSPHDPAANDTLGWALYKKGDYTRALGLLVESAGKLSNQAEIQFHLGMVQYMLGDEASARAALQQAANSTDEFPGKEEAKTRLAILALDVKTASAKTRADLEKHLQDEPNDPVAANRLAAIYERDGVLDKAAKTYEQTLKQNPQNAQLMGHLARIYVTLNDSDKALDMAKQAHKLAPDDATISCMLGRLVFQSGDYTWASSLLQDAAPKLPNQPDVQYDLAWAYYSIGRVGDAERTMQSAAPALTGARLDDAKQFLAMVAAAKTPTQATAAQAGQILSANANYVPALMASAVQAEQQGKPDDAIKLYEKVLARYPAFSPAIRNLAILYAQRPADDQKAYDLAVKARTAFPEDVSMARTLGILTYRRGDYARASQLLQEGGSALNKDGEGLYYLGMAHYQLKQKAQSKAELQRALALNLDSKLADTAKKTLAELK